VRGGGEGGRVEGSLIRPHLPLIKEGGGEGGHNNKGAGGLDLYFPLHIFFFLIIY
jgi:hypothetical protein